MMYALHVLRNEDYTALQYSCFTAIEPMDIVFML